jgi:hypothetical protein
MQTQWYGDNRDLVKWAALIDLCKERRLKAIIQVPFLNDTESNRDLCIDDRLPRAFPKSVWSHFRDLSHVKKLGRRENLDVQIVDRQFLHGDRDAYIDHVCKKVDQYTNSKAVFLDPDTGIEPQKPNARHVLIKEIEQVWGCLKRGDWLVLYQHASRRKDWRTFQQRKFAGACGGAAVRTYACKVARDVVFFCAERKP